MLTLGLELLPSHERKYMLEERFEVSGGWSYLEPLLPVLICFPLGHHSGAPHHQDRAYSITWQNHLAEHVFQHALDL